MNLETQIDNKPTPTTLAPLFTNEGHTDLTIEIISWCNSRQTLGRVARTNSYLHNLLYGESDKSIALRHFIHTRQCQNPLEIKPTVFLIPKAVKILYFLSTACPTDYPFISQGIQALKQALVSNSKKNPNRQSSKAVTIFSRQTPTSSTAMTYLIATILLKLQYRAFDATTYNSLLVTLLVIEDKGDPLARACLFCTALHSSVSQSRIKETNNFWRVVLMYMSESNPKTQGFLFSRGYYDPFIYINVALTFKRKFHGETAIMRILKNVSMYMPWMLQGRVGSLRSIINAPQSMGIPKDRIEAIKEILSYVKAYTEIKRKKTAE